MKHIILVEDDPAIRESLVIFLQSIDIRITFYQNGDNILSGNYETPDLFLIDKQLSGVDGLDICRHLKSIAASQNTPVIMMSASPSVTAQAASAGADAAIIKPFKLSEIKKVLRKHLQLPQI